MLLKSISVFILSVITFFSNLVSPVKPIPIPPNPTPISQSSPSPSPTYSPTPKATSLSTLTPKPQGIYFISPTNGQKVVQGEKYPVELVIPNPNEVAKVEFGMGKLNNPFNLYNLAQPPFKYLQKIPDPHDISTFMADGNTSYFVALIKYKSGKTETKSVKLTVLPPKASIWFVRPERGKVYRPDELIQIEVSVYAPGEKITQVDFYVGAGNLLKTFTTPPYSLEYNLRNYCSGITAKQVVPLGVTAITSSGNHYTDSTDIYCQPYH
jgi:hypothetical protein